MLLNTICFELLIIAVRLAWPIVSNEKCNKPLTISLVILSHEFTDFFHHNEMHWGFRLRMPLGDKCVCLVLAANFFQFKWFIPILNPQFISVSAVLKAEKATPQ